MTGTYRLAGLTVEVTSLFPDVHELAAEYRAVDGPPDITVRIAAADIDRERARVLNDRLTDGSVPGDGYLETLAVYRQIAEKAPFHDTVLMHGSCVAVDGVGYLFTAPSGTGKSTHTRLWRQLLGDRAVMINDDKPLIRLTESGVVACGTPWDGKHRLSTNRCVPLRAICLLRRGTEDRVFPLTGDKALPALLGFIYRPADRQALARTLELAEKLTAATALWQLDCTPTLHAAQTAFDAMKG